MTRLPPCIAILLWVCACGSGEGVAPTSAPAAPVAAAKPLPAPAPPAAPNPCATPGKVTLEIEAGVVQQTPWGLELTYAIDEDDKVGPGYMFLLRSGAARWETRRDKANWRRSMTWRGFCWRGVGLPERRSSRVTIEIAPVCKDGVLQELGGCSDALTAERGAPSP
jgi:hypothetical protein